MMIAIDPPLKSRTKLGAALRAHRARAVAAGMKMLSSEELDAQFRMLRR